MIVGIGVDILEVSRIKKEQSRRILSEQELKIFDSFSLESRQLEFLAGRFTLKEAVIKAIGRTNYRVGMRDITIINDETGMPQIIEPNIETLKIHITLSHEKDYCIGMCIIENV